MSNSSVEDERGCLWKSLWKVCITFCSRAGLGYLIVYGSQVFKMDLVMATVLLLALAAAGMYQGILLLEKVLKKHLGVSA